MITRSLFWSNFIKRWCCFSASLQKKWMTDIIITTAATTRNSQSAFFIECFQERGVMKKCEGVIKKREGQWKKSKACALATVLTGLASKNVLFQTKTFVPYTDTVHYPLNTAFQRFNCLCMILCRDTKNIWSMIWRSCATRRHNYHWIWKVRGQGYASTIRTHLP